MAALSRAYVPHSEEDIILCANTNDDDEIDANERESVDTITTNLQRATVPNITMNTLNYMLVPLSMPATFKAAGWTRCRVPCGEHVLVVLDWKGDWTRVSQTSGVKNVPGDGKRSVGEICVWERRRR